MASPTPENRPDAEEPIGKAPSNRPDASPPAASSVTPPTQRSLGLMLGLAAGHGIKHFYSQAFLLLLPAVKVYLGLSDIEIGLIGSTRTIFGAVVNIPAGIMADMWRSKVGLMLTASLTSLAIGYLIIGAAPSYWLLLLGVAITGAGASIWHAPAFGTLAVAYPNKRATSFAVHRMGGSSGDSLAPLVMGVILGGFAFWGLEWDGLQWRTLSYFLVIPAGLAAFVVLLSFRNIEGASRDSPDFRSYLRSARTMLSNTTVLGMVGISGVRSMAHNSLTIFLVIYMSEDLNFSEFKIGYHVALLTLFGVASSPVLGLISDRVNRRPVMFVSLLIMALLIYSLIFFGSGWSFTLILALIGLFLYSVNPIMMAAAIDATKKGTEASGVALMFAGSAIFGSISPIIAGWLRGSFGMDGVFYYAGIIVTLVAFAALFVPLRKATD